MPLSRPPRRWLLIGLLAIILVAAGGCASEKWGKEISFILERMEQGETAAIEYEGELLVPAEDVPTLFDRIRSSDTMDERRRLISAYLTRRERIDCILEDFEEAAEKEEEIKCSGAVVVEKDDVPEFAGQIRSLSSEQERVDFVTNYIYKWETAERIDRALERLIQMKNTRNIPLIGGLLDSITRFSITWEGQILVPKDEIPMLLDQMDSISDEEARRDLIATYLHQRQALSFP